MTTVVVFTILAILGTLFIVFSRAIYLGLSKTWLLVVIDRDGCRHEWSRHRFLRSANKHALRVWHKVAEHDPQTVLIEELELPA